MHPRLALVVGYGNELRGDDGIGQVVVRLLNSQQQEVAELADASFIWSPQLVPEIALDLSGAGFVVFVDAVQDGQPPGSVSVRPLSSDDGAQCGLDRRTLAAACWVDLSPVGLLLLSADLFGSEPPGVLVSVSVGEPTTGLGLSAPVRAAVPVAAHAVVRAIRSWRAPADEPARHHRVEPSLVAPRLVRDGGERLRA
jgi:hydrogenase maturation protease